jgi:hypothetical protein
MALDYMNQYVFTFVLELGCKYFSLDVIDEFLQLLQEREKSDTLLLSIVKSTLFKVWFSHKITDFSSFS